MKNIKKSFFIGGLIAVMAISFLNSSLFAQKRFEGYLEQTTVRQSTLPMQKPEVVEKEKVFYKPGKMKTVNFTTGKTMIFRFDKELMWSLDDNNKTYTEATFAQMQQQVQQVQSMMQERMKNIPPEQRKMMEKLMGKQFGAPSGDAGSFMEITMKRGGKTKKILGYPCEQIFMNLNGEPIMELWMTNKYSIGNDFLKIYQKMGFMKGKLSEDAKKLQGLPLKTKMTMDLGMGKMVSETVVDKLVKTSIPDKEFEVPNGYKQQPSKKMQFK